MSELLVKRLSVEAILPTRTHADDAGLDFYTLEDIILQPSEGRLVGTGVAIALPAGHVGLILDRSSFGQKGIKTAGGVIDAGYRGEIKIALWNISSVAVWISRGDRIAQLVILPIVTPSVKEVHDLDDTSRGTTGFGASGK